MIKRQLRWTPCRMPRRSRGIIASLGEDSAIKHRGEYNADGVPPRVTAWISECADLLETNATEAGLLEEFASGGLVQ